MAYAKPIVSRGRDAPRATTPNLDQTGAARYIVLKKVKGLNTQPSRQAVGMDEFSWLENAMPIGDAYMPTVPQVGAATATVTSAIDSMQFANIGSNNYQVCFTVAGGAQAVNLGNGTVTTLFADGTFTDPAMDQWKSERIVITDATGFYSWDGSLTYGPGSLATISVTAGGSGYTATPVVGLTGGTAGTTATAVAIISGGAVSSVSITAVGSGYTAAPAVSFTGGTAGTTATASAFLMPSGMEGSAIAVFSGRAWVANGRVISFTAPDTWYDVNSADAAGSFSITEGFLRQMVRALKALDNYLYIFGDSSIFIVGDLKVTGSITTFSLTALSSTTGTTLRSTVTAMERAIVFMNRYGVYALFGASVSKISRALDGIFPLIDFDEPISAGLVQIYNILCYAVNFTYQDEGVNRAIQAVFFDGKWFLTSQGNALSFVSASEIDGEMKLWGTSGTEIRPLYDNTTATIATTIQTGLYPMESPIFNKQVIAAGIEFSSPAASQVTLAIDTEDDSVGVNFISSNEINWTNNAGSTLTFTNTAGLAVQWVSDGFELNYNSVSITGKYIGFTATSNSPRFVTNGILAEYVQRDPWGNP